MAHKLARSQARTLAGSTGEADRARNCVEFSPRERHLPCRRCHNANPTRQGAMGEIHVAGMHVFNRLPALRAGGRASSVKILHTALNEAQNMIRGGPHTAAWQAGGLEQGFPHLHAAGYFPHAQGVSVGLPTVGMTNLYGVGKDIVAAPAIKVGWGVVGWRRREGGETAVVGEGNSRIAPAPLVRRAIGEACYSSRPPGRDT